MIFDNNFNSLFIVLILFSIFYLFLEYKSSKVKFQASSSGNTYLVRQCSNSLDAANLLDTLAQNGNALITHLNAKLNDTSFVDYSEYKRFEHFIRRLTENYDSNTISESSPGNEYTSYTINKGKKIVFCIRQKPPTGANPKVFGCGDLVDVNVMMFVFLHELAHLGTCSIGHPPDFWCNMAFLLKVGADMDPPIYTKLDIDNSTIPYCGINITNSPPMCGTEHVPSKSCS
tara:strand:- start:192 stop:881 length:690 start_codon:yes stop_codon:yes gene_type:complete